MPETRLIDGAELKKRIESTICYGCQIGHMVPPCGKCYVSIVLRYIDEMPTIDAQPVKHGHWVELPKALNRDENPCQCSNCKHVISFYYGYPKSKFCDECGAKMDGDADETE